MSESTLEVKQQYLRQKIIDTGYDPQNFVQFCSEKHNLDDLQNWSMKQLVEIVDQFITYTQNKKTETQKIKIQGNNQFQYAQNMLTTTSLSGMQNNNGLMLSDVDWNVLLSEPLILDNSSKNAVPFDFNIDIISPQNNQIQSSITQKQIKASDAIQQKKNLQNIIKTQNIKEINQFQDKQAEMIKNLIQKKQKGQSKNKANIPINLSNIRLCVKKQKCVQTNINISDVVVQKTEQISRNFLQADYTLYHIRFLPIQHKIERKFSDLRRLRLILQKLYPFLRLPYLQPQGWISSSQGKDPQNLIKYKIMVEQFLLYIIVKSQELKNTEIVRIFCGLSQKGQLPKDEFKKKLQFYQNIPKPKFIKDISLKQNQIIMAPTCHQQQHISNTLSLINEYDLIYEKLRKQLDSLFLNYDLLTKSYADIINTFELLENLIKKYKAKSSVEGQINEIRFFEGLRQSTIKFSNKISQEFILFRTRIKHFFRYQKDNMHTLKEVIEARNKIHAQYVRQGYPNLSSGKHKDGSIEIQSSIPLQQPIKNNKNILSVQQIFWSFMINRQIDRYWHLLRKKICEHLTIIAYDELQSQNKNLNFWNSMIKKCVL